MSLDRRRKETNPRKQFEKKTARENSARKTKSEATNELRIQRKPLKHQVVGRPRTREREFSRMFLNELFFPNLFLIKRVNAKKETTQVLRKRRKI